MNKQTAVEWLIKTIIEDKTLKNEFQWKLIFDKAKEMEKQQIMDAWIATDNELQRLAAEQYYNETYNNGK
ncbi:MAG: hypothetical protein ACK566_03415 [Bacteroidota bacterium]|jgi:DNA polymerase III psi subunit